MALIWKRIKDRTAENHPMKCLILLEFLLREGNADMVMKQVQKNLSYVEQLKHFTLYNEQQQDLGIKGARRRAGPHLARIHPHADPRRVCDLAPIPRRHAGAPRSARACRGLPQVPEGWRLGRAAGGATPGRAAVG
jgi:hypothetical protein